MKTGFLNQGGEIHDFSLCAQGMECSLKRPEEVFAELIADDICGLFFTDFASKENAKRLVKKLLYPQIKQLVEEHSNHVAEKIAERFKNEFGINKKVDYKYADHAKLSTMFQELKNKLCKKCLKT